MEVIYWFGNSDKKISNPFAGELDGALLYALYIDLVVTDCTTRPVCDHYP